MGDRERGEGRDVVREEVRWRRSRWEVVVLISDKHRHWRRHTTAMPGQYLGLVCSTEPWPAMVRVAFNARGGGRMGDGPCDGLDGWAMGTWPWTWTWARTL
jgi:hypothetical protein